jgi:hypothetical protein
MNPVTGEMLDTIRHASVLNDPKKIQHHINAALIRTVRRDRRQMTREINRVLIDTSIENNSPGILPALQVSSDEDTIALISRIIQQYITHLDDAWLEAVFSITSRLERKSNQSRVFALVAKKMIETGVAESNPALIQHGLQTLDRISFRKYRSEIIAGIIPLLNSWAVGAEDTDLLLRAYTFTEEIADIAKRSAEQSNVAIAMASIAISRHDLSLFLDSLRTAGTIKQKTRRQGCIALIIRNGAPVFLSNAHLDILQFIHCIEDQPEEIVRDIISACLADIFDRTTDPRTIINALDPLAHMMPVSHGTIMSSLLKKAEKDGVMGHLSAAMEFGERFIGPTGYPVRDLVKAGISVARKTSDPRALVMVVPFVEQSCDAAESSRLYLRLIPEMLALGDIEDTVQLFKKIRESPQNQPLYDECYCSLLKQSVLSDKVSLIRDSIADRGDNGTGSDILSRAIMEISRHAPFPEITRHRASIHAFVNLHPKKDVLVMDIITLLINRGLLDVADPDVLIQFTESIGDMSLRERALSMIVIKLASIGVRSRNRDFLQRSVGLTCLIEEKKTRSATLTTIIDEATVLAVLDRDLDLLRRMREWSASLLSPEGEIFAMANIVDGMIKYAMDTRHPGALEEAYLIAMEIHDPSLRKELVERICVCSVQTGCLILEEARFSSRTDELTSALSLFERGLELLLLHGKKEERSLKLAHFIDISLDYMQRTKKTDYVIPLSLYVLEIGNIYERDAMVSRIVEQLALVLESTDSTDPYETLASHLQRIEPLRDKPALPDLIVRLAGQIRDPFTRFLRLIRTAQNYLRLNLTEKAMAIIQEIRSSLDQVPARYQEVILRSYLTDCYAIVSRKDADQCLEETLDLLAGIDDDHASVARRQLVSVMIRYHGQHPDITLFDNILKVASGISDPVDYVDAMRAIHHMVQHDPVQGKAIQVRIEQKCKTIRFPVQRALLLLDLVTLLLEDQNEKKAYTILDQIADIPATISIPFIADTIRMGIIVRYQILYTKNHDEGIQQKVQDVARNIEHDEIRRRILTGNAHIYWEIPPDTKKIQDLCNHIIIRGARGGNTTQLEQTIRSVPDNRKKAYYYVDVALLFRAHARHKSAKKFLLAAIDEAVKIRPLSRRSYMLCDIALLLHSAGCEKEAQDVIDMAVDTATSIRQSAERDEVFENISITIKFLREPNR